MYFNAGRSIRTGQLDYELYQHSHVYNKDVGFYNCRGNYQTLLGLIQYVVSLMRTDLTVEYKVGLRWWWTASWGLNEFPLPTHCFLRQLLDISKAILCPRFENLKTKIHYFFTLQTRRLSSLVGWWWTASGGKVRNQITLIKTWTSTIPVQIQSWDFGEIKLGLLADCVEALKIREIRLVFVNRAP